MFYITKHYTTIAGTFLRPGEVFEADETAKIARLLEKGAIAKATPATPFEAPAPTGDKLADIRSNHEDQMKNLGYDASGNPLEGQEAEDEENDVDLTDTFEEEAEAPEIDVMEGICVDEPAEEEPAPAPTKARGRKK